MKTKMVNLKLPKKPSTGDLSVPMSAAMTPAKDRDAYPYGTRLDFEEDQVSKFKGLDPLPDAETKVTGTFEGYVSRAEVRDTADGGKKRSLCIQVTDVALDFGDEIEKKEAKQAKRTGELLSPTR